MTRYDIDERSISLDALQDRLECTDLVPSHEPLLDGLPEKLTTIKKAGVMSLADLQRALKSEKSIKSLSNSTGISTDYLQLLKRVIKGFVPKPRPLRKMDWLGAQTIKDLNASNIKNTQQVFDAANGKVATLVQNTGLSKKDAQELLSISDLCRIQWVSPRYARALIAAGATNSKAIAAANPEALYEAVKKANAKAKFFKGTAGLRDVKRLVAAAHYVPQ